MEKRHFPERIWQRFFTITNLAVSRYELPDSKGEAITDAFFEDERRKFNPGGDFEIKKFKHKKR